MINNTSSISKILKETSNMLGDYSERGVADKVDVKGLTVSTCWTTDCGEESVYPYCVFGYKEINV